MACATYGRNVAHSASLFAGFMRKYSKHRYFSNQGEMIGGPMRSVDLGLLEGPVLIFGGPYSNLEATQRILDCAIKRNIPPSRVICTGDTVAYCSDAAETVRLIQESGIHVLKGNIEESLGKSLDNCGCGFEENTTCNVLSVQWYRHADGQVTGDQRQWMQSLPEHIHFRLGLWQCLVVHGAVNARSAFIFRSTADSQKTRQFQEANQLGAQGTMDCIIAGHCGLPFTQRLPQGVWHNAGVIGMPANDGTPRAWYSLLTPCEEGVHVQHIALKYDFELTSSKMEAQGLVPAYAQALRTGLWPSLDVLGNAEREATGQALPLGGMEHFFPWLIR